MPHLHPIDGFSIAASQYQAYLERMRVAHPDEYEARIRKKNPASKRDDYVDPDAESESGASDQQSEGEQQEDGNEPKDGFGNHYA